MKLDYTISRIFQEMSLSELETLHHQKASELSLVTQKLIYNQLEYILNLIYNITLEHNSFKNY